VLLSAKIVLDLSHRNVTRITWVERNHLIIHP